ncbi:MAG: hypothetical protein IT200_03645 [Thermoleophilia bacterium]|nr:hypothetical protein [Thermoleophilia bacterium]
MTHRSRGQATLELLAAVPVILAAALLAWQVAAACRAVIDAEEGVRRAALHATGPAGAVVTVTAEVPVPGPFGVRAAAAGAVRLP